MSGVTVDASQLKPNGKDPAVPQWSDLCRNIKEALEQELKTIDVCSDSNDKSSLSPVALDGLNGFVPSFNATTATSTQLSVSHDDCVKLWSNSLLSFIALSATAKHDGTLYFKVIDNERIHKPLLEPTKGKFRRNVVKTPAIPKDDNRLISAVAKASFIALDGDKKKSPNSPGKVAYKSKDGQWEIPKAYPKGIYSLGNIKEEKATKALEHLKSLVEDFKIVKDSKQTCIFDEDENNSDLDSSHMSRFFKSNQTNVPPPLKTNSNDNDASVIREDQSRERANQLLKLMLLKKSQV